jgi:hypothetical protein
MRVLILSAILACAASAPSAPVLAIAPIIPAALPTLSPGDLQAAAIDAKVQAEDQARAIADQARLAADVARDQALALEGQKIVAYAAPSAPLLAIAPATPGDLQAAAIDAKVQAEDQARAIADQARLAAEVALEEQKIVAYAAPSAPLLAIAPAIPGDLQAAAIDAKVQAEDQARAIADQARLAAEAALEGQKEKIEEVTSIAKEKDEELFWNVEDKKWQAIDAVKTVEAKLDGAIASNADTIAKSLTYPVVSPILPYPNLIYPGLTLVKEDTLLKTGDRPKESEEKAKLELLAAPHGVGLVGAWGSSLGAPVVYPGLLGAPVLQPIITPVLKQW